MTTPTPKLPPELLHACPECRGAGTVGCHIPGNEGVPEQDLESYCSSCCGMGYLEAADMLRTLVSVSAQHRLARMMDQPGLGAAISADVARVLATMPYSSLRYAEMKR